MKILKIFLKLFYAHNNLNMLHRHFLLYVSITSSKQPIPSHVLCCFFAISKYRTSVGLNLDLTTKQRYHKYH